jgi:rSAM/selenodomain-associated transferase 2
LAVAGSVALLGWVLRRVELESLVATFQALRVPWFLGAVGAFGLGLLGSGLRWHLMMRLNREAVVHGAASVRMVFISQFFNTLLGGPSGGDLPKTALYSRWYGVPAAEVLAGSVLDRMVASVGGLVFVVLSVGAGLWVGAFDFLWGGRWTMPGAWVGWLGLAGLGLAVAVVAWGRRHPGSFVGRALRSLGTSAGGLLGSRRKSGQALFCAFLTAALFNVTQLLCLQAVSPEPIPWLKLFWMYHLVTVISALPVTVAGTGLREGASMVLLAKYGIGAPTAVAAALLTLSIHLGWAGVGAWLLAREQRRRRGVVRGAVPRTLSAVVPVWNEERQLGEMLARLKRVPEVVEIIVADGGSTDGTRVVAASAGARVVEAGRGRGLQLATGAEAAVGDVVWLVHADTWVEPEAGAALIRCLRDPLVVGGGCWKTFRDGAWVMRGSRIRCWLRLWWNGRVLGDQAMFVRREVLKEVGGVPRQPLLEELELCRRLRRVGRLALAGTAVSTSARRFREQGVWRTWWLMGRIWRDYRRGVSPEELVERYHGKR